MTPQVVKILLVEDDPGDVELIRQSFKESRGLVDINHVPDGQECMDYLNQEGPYKESVRPDLILLDLNMPRKDGREVLKEIKQDQKLRKIPILILTTSDADADIDKSYDLGANCFITKPIEFEEFKRVVDRVTDFWFSVVKLPNQKDTKKIMREKF